MFNKTKLKLRDKIIRWLGIDKIIEEAHETEHHIKQRLCDIERKSIEDKTFNRKWGCNIEGKYNSLHNTIQTVVNMGADIRPQYDKNGSWAVVCFNRGNVPIVKFIPLNGRDGREMYDYLKNFDASNYKIDAPMGYLNKDMFFDWRF